MKPPEHKREFEKIRTDDFVLGEISEVLYDQVHAFKGYQGGPDTTQAAVRLKFTIEGCKFPHSTPWMKFSYSEKSNVYKKYISSLVDGAKEYMDFDMDLLKGMKVKMLWKDVGDFQGIETIRPVGGKIKVNGSDSEPSEAHEDEVLPF